jgi:hypothetical protein
MRVCALAIAVALIAAGCATEQQASVEDRSLAFGCADIAVIGTVENGTYKPVDDENDLLGHGWISAALHVRRVVRGAPIPSVLSVRYFAHTYMRDDREFMFVLKRGDAGYEIATGQLMSLRPRLADQCG